MNHVEFVFPKQKRKAYLVSHNGLGDNLFMIGALRFIQQFYDNVYFLCKKKYINNVELFFEPGGCITCVPLDDEINEIIQILSVEKYMDKYVDIFVCGCHTSYRHSKINNRQFLHHINTLTLPSTTTDVPFCTNPSNFYFIEIFYQNIRLNSSYYYAYFDLPNNDVSKRLYKTIAHFPYIVFVQFQSSDKKSLNISHLMEKYLDNPETIIVCNDKNLYQPHHSQYTLVEAFFQDNKIVHYVDVIKNSHEIYLIDSCFVGIVLPFFIQNKLKTDVKIKIVMREDTDKHII